MFSLFQICIKTPNNCSDMDLIIESEKADSVRDFREILNYNHIFSFMYCKVHLS